MSRGNFQFLIIFINYRFFLRTISKKIKKLRNNFCRGNLGVEGDTITVGRNVAGMEVGPSNGDPLQGNSVGVDGRGTAGEDCGMRSAGPLRQPLSHQRLRPGTRSLPRQFYHQPR